MKRIIFIAMMSLCIFSCEKDNDLKSEAIPIWLKTRINQDEALIKSNTQSGLDCAAWIRYKYNDNYYYEYRNNLSSSGPKTYNNNGAVISFQQQKFNDYLKNRCCKLYVWKGSTYIEY